MEDFRTMLDRIGKKYSHIDFSTMSFREILDCEELFDYNKEIIDTLPYRIYKRLSKIYSFSDFVLYVKNNNLRSKNNEK